MKILIVDDNRDLADGLAVVLEDEGHDVRVAYTAGGGIDLFRSEKPDALFLDVKLPDQSGIDVFRLLHQEQPDVRIVMMTGYRIEQLLAEVVEQGAVAVLRKPFSMETVLEKLCEVNGDGIVLIADDDPDFADGMAEYLSTQGKQTIIARTGEEALDLVLTNKIDVLVLDLRLPVICGMDVYLELKSRGKAVPTIIVTGYGKSEKDTIDTLRSMEVTGCLFKPFEPAALINAIQNL